jgi:hypothetical protein
MSLETATLHSSTHLVVKSWIWFKETSKSISLRDVELLESVIVEKWIYGYLNMPNNESESSIIILSSASES